MIGLWFWVRRELGTISGEVIGGMEGDGDLGMRFSGYGRLGWRVGGWFRWTKVIRLGQRVI